MDSLQGRLEIEPGQPWLKYCFIPNIKSEIKSLAEIQYSLRILFGVSTELNGGSKKTGCVLGDHLHSLHFCVGRAGGESN